jgi:hypothetical protein
MNEWAAQRSFINRLRSRLIHPPYDAPWYAKIFGYAWRLTLVVGLLSLIAFVGLKVRMRSAGFRSTLAEQVAQRYHATNVTCGKTKSALFADSCMITALGADGAEGCIFNRLDAYDIGFDLGWKFLHTDWKIDRLFVNRMEISLRTGDLSQLNSAPVPEAKQIVPDRVVIPDFKTSSISKPILRLQGGYGLTPDFKELEIGAFDIRELTMKWGYSTTTSGGFSDANTTIDPTPNGGWILEATSGRFGQNWLTDLQIDRLEAELKQDTIEVKKAQFTHGGTGHVIMNGSIGLGKQPDLNLGIMAQGVNLKSFTPAPFNRYFDASADLEGKITGTIGLASGVKTNLKVRLVPPATKQNPAGGTRKQEENGKPIIAYLANNIPVLRALYVASGEDRLMQVAITDGSFDLETGGGKMTISNINLASNDLFRLRGTIEATEELMAEPTTLTTATMSAPTITYRARGQILIGVNAETALSMPKVIQERYFTQQAEGFYWMKAIFMDEDGQDLTRGIGEEITRLQKESLVQKPK